MTGYVRAHSVEEALGHLSRGRCESWPAARTSIRRWSIARCANRCSTCQALRPARHLANRRRLPLRRPDHLERRHSGRPAGVVRRAEAGGARGGRRADPECGHRGRQHLQCLAGRRRHRGAAGPRRRGRGAGAARGAADADSRLRAGAAPDGAAAGEMVTAVHVPAWRSAECRISSSSGRGTIWSSRSPWFRPSSMWTAGAG
jgi:hypothetical protein